MSDFKKLVKAIKLYDQKSNVAKSTAHHSAVSVRVDEMKKHLSNIK